MTNGRYEYEIAMPHDFKNKLTGKTRNNVEMKLRIHKVLIQKTSAFPESFN